MDIGKGEKNMEENNNYYQQQPEQPQQPQQQQPSYNRPPLSPRNIGVCIILSIVTCSLYMWYWLYKLAEDLNNASEEKNPTSGAMLILLTIVTCNIYGWYWLYKAGQQVNSAKKLRNMQPDSNAGIIYLVLAFFGLNVVSYAIIQNELNTFAAMDSQK